MSPISFNPEPAATGYGANASLPKTTPCCDLIAFSVIKDRTKETGTRVGTVARRRWLRGKRWNPGKDVMTPVTRGGDFHFLVLAFIFLARDAELFDNPEGDNWCTPITSSRS